MSTIQTTFTPFDIESEEKLVSWLNSYKIDTSKWIKSVSTLYKEIESCECSLGLENGKIHRRVEVAAIKCFYTNESGERFQLFEEKQVFNNGTQRQRGFKHIAEKLQDHETPLEAAERGIEEELQIPKSHLRITELADEHITNKRESDTYVGLQCSYNTYAFSCEISKEDYKNEYTEIQKDKTTYFKWMKI